MTELSFLGKLSLNLFFRVTYPTLIVYDEAVKSLNIGLHGQHKLFNFIEM